MAVAVKDRPPSELSRCPVAPIGFPTDASATMPPAVRAAAIRLARAYAETAAQLARLIDWVTPGACHAAAEADR